MYGYAPFRPATVIVEYDGPVRPFLASGNAAPFTAADSVFNGRRILYSRYTCAADEIRLTDGATDPPRIDTRCPIRLSALKTHEGGRSLSVTVSCTNGCRTWLTAAQAKPCRPRFRRRCVRLIAERTARTDRRRRTSLPLPAWATGVLRSCGRLPVEVLAQRSDATGKPNPGYLLRGTVTWTRRTGSCRAARRGAPAYASATPLRGEARGLWPTLPGRLYPG